MTATTKARHRKATRALTPLSEVAPSARLGLAVAATSGLAIAMVGSGAAVAASTATEVGESAGSLEAGIGALAAPAREAVTTNEAVTVAADTQWQGPSTTEVVAESAKVEEAKVEETKAEATERVAATPAAEQSKQESPQAPAATAAESKAPAPAASGSVSGSYIVALAKQYVGSAYVYGASGPKAFDCSGLVWYVFREAGINLPRTRAGQEASGTYVSASEAQPGDLMVYPGHIAIYAGGGMMIDAVDEGHGVMYRPMTGSPTFVRIL
ncbi:C40 family peptidase [Actinomyces trachealis]|uniref:C40 family peptidase n=1 Tax=Actinomyces trachealis TaxID=2763540 RepID=UPI001892ADC5|nr:C40 family peptidase [Actinomyces trachealis]